MSNKEEFFNEIPNQYEDMSGEGGFDEKPSRRRKSDDTDESVKISFSKQRANSSEEGRYLIRWKQRQRMAWYSFYAMIIFTVVLWFVVPVWYKHMDVDARQWTSNITDSSEWIYITFSGIILGYMGSTAWMVKGKKIELNEDDY